MCLCCSKGGVADLSWMGYGCGRIGVEEGFYWSAVTKGWGSGRSWLL